MCYRLHLECPLLGLVGLRGRRIIPYEGRLGEGSYGRLGIFECRSL